MVWMYSRFSGVEHRCSVVPVTAGKCNALGAPAFIGQLPRDKGIKRSHLRWRYNTVKRTLDFHLSQSHGSQRFGRLSVNADAVSLLEIIYRFSSTGWL